MPRTVTVTFQDGSQHAYQNVPDSVTPDAINARASKDFNQSVTGIDGGAKAATVAPKPATLGSTLKRAAWNLPMDTAETLHDTMKQFGPEGMVAQAAMHPIKAAQGVGDTVSHAADILLGGAQRFRELSPASMQGEAPKADTTAFDKFAGNFHDQYLTKQGLYKNIGDHPAGLAVTVASLLDPALKAANVKDGIVGAVDRGATNAVTSRIPVRTDPVPPTVPELKTTAQGLYNKAKKAGVVINSQSFSNMLDDAKTTLKDQGLDDILHPDATAAINHMGKTQGDVDLNNMERLRRVVGAATQATKPDDKRLSRMLLDHIDDYVQNLQPQNIVAGDAPAAVSLLNQARSTWQKAARGETIDKLIAKAQQNGGALKTGLDNAYRTQFKKLANSERGIARFTQEQQDAIRKVAFGDGPVQSVLNTVGRLIPTSAHSTLTTGGIAASAHLLGAPVTAPVSAAIGAAGLGGKIASTMITSRNAKLASELARGGSVPRSPAYLKIQARKAARASQGN